MKKKMTGLSPRNKNCSALNNTHKREYHNKREKKLEEIKKKRIDASRLNYVNKSFHNTIMYGPTYGQLE